MYYRKRPGAQEIADKCGIGDMFRAVNHKVHVDDMRGVKALLDMTNSGISLLFELEDDEEDAVRDLCDLFGEPRDEEILEEFDEEVHSAEGLYGWDIGGEDD